MVDKHVFCLPRSGSNYLVALVARNYPSSRHRIHHDQAFGKHDPNAKAKGLTILFPWKSQEAWLNSMFRYTFHDTNPDWRSPARDFQGWLKTPLGSEKVGIFENPWQLYLHFLRQAQRLRRNNTVIPVCYELLREWPEATVKAIFGPCGEFHNVKQEVLPSPSGAIQLGGQYREKPGYFVNTVDCQPWIEDLYR